MEDTLIVDTPRFYANCHTGLQLLEIDSALIPHIMVCVLGSLVQAIPKDDRPVDFAEFVSRIIDKGTPMREKIINDLEG